MAITACGMPSRSRRIRNRWLALASHLVHLNRRAVPGPGPLWECGEASENRMAQRHQGIMRGSLEVRSRYAQDEDDVPRDEPEADGRDENGEAPLKPALVQPTGDERARKRA